MNCRKRFKKTPTMHLHCGRFYSGRDLALFYSSLLNQAREDLIAENRAYRDVIYV